MSGDFSEAVVLTVSGRRVDLIVPSPETIDLTDIAWSLSRLARFNGHTATSRPLSVAEHSVRVAARCSPEARAWGLMHDAAEAYTGDIVAPVKRLMPAIAAVESRLLAAIGRRFGLPWPMPSSVAAEVAAADRAAFEEECRLYMAAAPDAFALGRPMGARAAQAAFVDSFDALPWGDAVTMAWAGALERAGSTDAAARMRAHAIEKGGKDAGRE